MTDIKIFNIWVLYMDTLNPMSARSRHGVGSGCYLYRKMKKLQEQYPFKNQILHNFHKKFFLRWILKFLQRKGQGGGLIFFVTYYYYFLNVIIKTLYISNFIVVYAIYFTHSLYYYVLMCFSLLLKNYNFSARNLSSPTIFDLDG